MQNWKKAVVFGSLAAGAVLLVTRRRPVGMALTAAGLAILASEYPEKFEELRQSLPGYFEHGMRVMEMAGQAGNRIAQVAGRSAAEVWDEIGG